MHLSISIMFSICLFAFILPGFDAVFALVVQNSQVLANLTEPATLSSSTDLTAEFAALSNDNPVGQYQCNGSEFGTGLLLDSCRSAFRWLRSGNETERIWVERSSGTIGVPLTIRFMGCKH